MDSYHHGDLRQALIDATESLLADKGPEGFSLREVARRAGVSPAAPAHHFGDASGLLTAVATVGFDGLAAAWRLREQGIAYVGFAMRFPGRFRLMFRDALRAEDPELQRAGNDAFSVLENGVRAAFAIPAGRPLGDKAWTALLALWSAVHGFAHLAIAGRLDGLAGRGGREAYVASTLRPVIECVVRGCVPVRPAKG
jgi:AcrR family transcriptional regulator